MGTTRLTSKALQVSRLVRICVRSRLVQHSLGWLRRSTAAKYLYHAALIMLGLGKSLPLEGSHTGLLEGCQAGLTNPMPELPLSQAGDETVLGEIVSDVPFHIGVH